MATHGITLLAGWYQIVETLTDGTATRIGNFRTEADARNWLTTYLRMQTSAEIFKVGFSVVQAAARANAAASIAAPDPH